MKNPCIFLNIDLPEVAWAAARGVLVPALVGKEELGWISVMFASIISNYKTARLVNETIIDDVRLQHHPQAVSRLTGLFFFEDSENARRAAHLWQGSFTLDNLTEVEILEDAPVSRYDSNWYTFAPRRNGVFVHQDIGWIDRYLSGESMPTKEPIWESVTQSRIKMADEGFKHKAQTLVHNKFPNSRVLLEIGKAAAKLGFDVANTNPFLGRDGDVYTINWYVDMGDAENPKFLRHLRSPGILDDKYDQYLSLMPNGKFFDTPVFNSFCWEGDASYAILPR